MLYHNVTRYTNSLLSCIHGNIANLLNIIYTLVAIDMILERLECITMMQHCGQSNTPNLLLIRVMEGFFQVLGMFHLYILENILFLYRLYAHVSSWHLFAPLTILCAPHIKQLRNSTQSLIYLLFFSMVNNVGVENLKIREIPYKWGI